jgi:ribose transport system permease protein
MTTDQQDPETAAPKRKSFAAGFPGRPRPSVSTILEQYGLVIFLIALIVFFAVWSKTSGTFLTSANIRTTLENQAVVTIAALGALIPFIAGQFDLTVGANGIVATFIVAALTTKAGVPAGLSCVIAVAAGAVIGAVSGIIVAYLRASSIVITLGMATLLGGLVILYSKGNSITGIPPSLISFGAENWAGVPRPLWLTLIILLLVGYFLRSTVTGRRLLMIGENPVAAALVGIRTQRLILLAFVLGGAFYGVAGVVLLANTGSASPSDGFSSTFQVLTAVFLGATTIRPGRFNVVGTIVGVLFIAVSVDGLSLAGASDWVQPVFTGAAVIVAVAASTVFARRRVS